MSGNNGIDGTRPGASTIGLAVNTETSMTDQEGQTPEQPQESGPPVHQIIKQLSRLTVRLVDHVLRAYGITADQRILLCKIGEGSGIISLGIAKKLDIEKSTLSRNLDRLVDLGMITRNPPTGRQGARLYLTKQGEETLRITQEISETTNTKIMVALGGPDVPGQLQRMLASMQDME